MASFQKQNYPKNEPLDWEDSSNIEANLSAMNLKADDLASQLGVRTYKT